MPSEESFVIGHAICPNCGHAWTTVAGVWRSWHCPICQHARRHTELDRLCRCGHPYREHRTFTTREGDVQLLGHCSTCSCLLFHPQQVAPPDVPDRAEYFEMRTGMVWRPGENPDAS